MATRGMRRGTGGMPVLKKIALLLAAAALVPSVAEAASSSEFVA